MDKPIEQETLETPEAEPLEELALPEVVEEQKETDYAKVVETNKKLYERAKKAEERLKTLKAEQPKAPESAPVTSQEDPIEAVLKLRAENYTDAEILDLRNQAKTLNVPVSTLLSNPIFKAGIEAKRHKAQIEQATPAPSNAIGRTINGKSWSQMTNEERRANFDQAMNGK